MKIAYRLGRNVIFLVFKKKKAIAHLAIFNPLCSVDEIKSNIYFTVTSTVVGIL